MNPRTLVPLIIAALILGSFAPHLDAKPRFPKVKPSPTPFHTTIESISTGAITISTPGSTETFKITRETEITYQGQTVPVSQLQTGMRVQVSPDGVDSTVAALISADAAPKVTPAKKK